MSVSFPAKKHKSRGRALYSWNWVLKGLKEARGNKHTTILCYGPSRRSNFTFLPGNAKFFFLYEFHTYAHIHIQMREHVGVTIRVPGTISLELRTKKLINILRGCQPVCIRGNKTLRTKYRALRSSNMFLRSFRFFLNVFSSPISLLARMIFWSSYALRRV